MTFIPSSSSSSSGLGASSCSGGDPEMLVTVTGAAGSINWLGETWNLPGDSGLEKTVCPTTYFLIKGTAFTGTYYYARHRWRFGTGNELDLYIRYQVGLFGSNWYRLTNFNWLTVKNSKDVRSFSGVAPSRPVPPTFTFTGYSNINNILGVGPPYYDTYTLTNEFFGSHTISGITYSWAKGAGW